MTDKIDLTKSFVLKRVGNLLTNPGPGLRKSDVQPQSLGLLSCLEGIGR